MTTNGPEHTSLVVEGPETTQVLESGQTLGFGRSTDLVLDPDNGRLHRCCGHLEHKNGCWWIANDGAEIELELYDGVSGHYIATLKPGQPRVLATEVTLVRLRAGLANYEVVVRQDLGPGPRSWQPPPDAAPTVRPPVPMPSTKKPFVMTHDQRLLAVGLCRRRLLDPTAINEPLLTASQYAAELGWSTTRWHAKLANVCQRLTDQGVPDLHHRVGDKPLPRDRRLTLIDHLLSSGMITIDDLRLLQ